MEDVTLTLSFTGDAEVTKGPGTAPVAIDETKEQE